MAIPVSVLSLSKVRLKLPAQLYGSRNLSVLDKGQGRAFKINLCNVHLDLNCSSLREVSAICGKL